jgi:hypothetical protein
MLAVLEDAIFCFQKFLFAGDIRRRTIFHQARNWLWSDRHNFPFSFRNVCDVPGFDANYLRYGLLRWQENRAARIMQDRRHPHPIRKAYRRGR